MGVGVVRGNGEAVPYAGQSFSVVHNPNASAGTPTSTASHTSSECSSAPHTSIKLCLHPHNKHRQAIHSHTPSKCS